MKRRIILTILYLLFLLALLEIWARGYYSIKRHISFFSSAGSIIYTWYPELKALNNYTYDGNKMNILLIGGSALTEDWGKVPQSLKKEFAAATGKEVNLVNLAKAAYSSLDSRYKYDWIGNKRFDLVIFYHGINETRANNVPNELFKKDYSHYAWYDEINFYFNHPYLCRAGFILPYFIKHLEVQLKREVLYRKQYVPEHSPRPEWVQYGKDIKTRVSFRDNLSAIIASAQRKHEALMVPTFAYYKTKKEDYDSQNQYVKFTEIWGKPEYVVLGIDGHNEVIRDLARGGKLIFLDLEKALNGEKRFFNDICHFSDEGSEAFARYAAEKFQETH